MRNPFFMTAFTLLLLPLSLGLASHSLIYVRLKRYGCIPPSYFSPYVHKKLSALFPRKEKKTITPVIKRHTPAIVV